MIEARKAHELDIVELTEDLPDFGVRRGERGTVVEAFDYPEEAYVLEFVDGVGSASRLAYGVTPEKLINVDAIAREHYSRGMRSLEKGDYVSATRELKEAIGLIPSYIRGLHESLRQAFAPKEDWASLISALQFVIPLDPNYLIAKHNLAIAFLNYGVQLANKGNYSDALQLFQSALRVEAQEEVVSLTTENISTTHRALAITAHKANDMLLACKHFESAYIFKRDLRTKQDLALIYFYVGDYYLNKNDPNGAATYYQWAQDTGLTTPEVLNNHGVALAVKGDINGAIVLFEMALGLTPDDEILEANLRRASDKRSASEFVKEQTHANFNPVPPLHVAALSVTI
jgi:tetratricopeptide (TPR) repeat protein